MTNKTLTIVNNYTGLDVEIEGNHYTGIWECDGLDLVGNLVLQKQD